MDSVDGSSVLSFCLDIVIFYSDFVASIVRTRVGDWCAAGVVVNWFRRKERCFGN